MTVDTPKSGLSEFLAKHEPVLRPKLYGIGVVLDEWRITGFLGSGGNAEVYRVIRESSVGALKILLRDDDASKTRFRQESALLSSQLGTSFAKLYASGESAGRPYLVTELLEPVDLPSGDAAVAAYLLSVCDAVGALHRLGLVHRDIKPSNIMRRANGELVLIDLGLVKDTVKSSDPERDVSIVSGRVVAVGTPRFAAPEQMLGGEVTAAADIHAIGRLADAAFGASPPRCWLPLIRRATSSIPEQRYQTVDELAHAIRHRHRPARFVLLSALAGLFLSILAAVVGTATLGRPQQPMRVDDSVRPGEDRSADWAALCRTTMTNLVSREIVSETPFTNRVGKYDAVMPLLKFRLVTNRVEAVLVRLHGVTNVFDRPIVLDASREYFIEGPGRLDADLRAKGGEVRLHLKNCFVFNRSTVPLDKAGLRYVSEGGVYLNFTEQDRPPSSIISERIEEFDSACDAIRFSGPRSKMALESEIEESTRRQLLLDL